MAEFATVDTRALEALAKVLADGPQRLRQIVVEAVQYGMPKGAAYARQLVTNDVLKVRTGELRRRIEHRTDVAATVVTGRLGYLSAGKVPVQAAVHERGSDGAILPNKPDGRLTIPLPAAKTPAGVPRFTAREAETAYPAGTFIATSRAGNLILFGKTGQSGTIRRGVNKGRDRSLVPLFLLVKSVPQIPAKHFLRRGVEEAAVPAITQRIQSRSIALFFAEHGGQTVDA